MQASISQRVARSAKPFGSARPVPCRPAVARGVQQWQQQQQQPCVAARAAAAFDVSELAGDVDVSVGGTIESAPLAPENVRLRIRLRGYDVSLLADATEQIRAIAETTGSAFKGPVMLPTRKKLYTVLRSPHVNKDSREQFEIRTHHRWGPAADRATGSRVLRGSGPGRLCVAGDRLRQQRAAWRSEGSGAFSGMCATRAQAH